LPFSHSARNPRGLAWNGKESEPPEGHAWKERRKAVPDFPESFRVLTVTGSGTPNSRLKWPRNKRFPGQHLLNLTLLASFPPASVGLEHRQATEAGRSDFNDGTERRQTFVNIDESRLNPTLKRIFHRHLDSKWLTGTSGSRAHPCRVLTNAATRRLRATLAASGLVNALHLYLTIRVKKDESYKNR